MNHTKEIDDIESDYDDCHCEDWLEIRDQFRKLLALAKEMQEEITVNETDIINMSKELSKAQKYITVLETRLCCYGEFTDH
jgi:hypothetical protein